MASGIRATVAFDTDVCPLAALAERTGARVDSVTTAGDPPTSVVEFTVHDDHDPSAVEGELLLSHASGDRYRLTREDPDCPCACLSRLGCPVTDYVAREERLTLVFNAVNYDELRTAIGTLRERFPDVDIRRLVRSSSETESTEEVLVDRTVLTDRQLEVVETAYEMGYFERPRRANATAVAAELGIDQSTFSEHLAAAESKLLRAVLRRAD